MMEIGLIIVLAVMLFPPKELPKLARMIARVYGQVRKTAEDFRSAVLEDEDLREPIEEIKGAYNDARWEIRDAERKARQQLAKAQMEMRMATARRIQAEREAKTKADSEAANDAGEQEQSGAESADAVAAGSGESLPVAPVAGPVAGPAAGPVAGTDPRIVAARRSGAYTPRATEGEPSPDPWKPGTAGADSSESASQDEPREGVA